MLTCKAAVGKCEPFLARVFRACGSGNLNVSEAGGGVTVLAPIT